MALDAKLVHSSLVYLFTFFIFSAAFLLCGYLSRAAYVWFWMPWPTICLSHHRLLRRFLHVCCSIHCFSYFILRYISTQIGHYTTMFPSFLFLCCFLTSFLFLPASCMSLQLDVAHYACVTKISNLLDNKTTSV